MRWLQSTQVLQSSTLTLHSNGLVNLNDRNQAFKSVTFNGGRISTGVTSGSGRLQVTEQIISNPTNITALIDGAGFLLLLSTNVPIPPLEITVGDGPVNPDLWINTVIGSFGGFNKRGDGELLLSAPNTYLGATEVFAGILQLQHDSALGSTNSTASTTVHDGATLQVENLSSNFKETIFLSGTGRGGTSGALYSLGGCTIAPRLNMTGDTTIRADSTSQALFIDAAITGTGSLTKGGTGFLTFGGSTANSYSGETFVTAGRLTLQKPVSVTAIPSHLTIGTAGIFALNSADVVHQQSFLIIGSVTVHHNGVWNLNNFSEGFSVAALEGRPPLTLNGGGDVQTGSGTVFLPQGGDVVVDPQFIQNASSFISGNLGLDPGPHHFVVGSALHVGRFNPELTISAVISQTSSAADVIKDGGGDMRLDRANTFTGTATVNDGSLTISNSGSLGTSGGGGTIVNGNGSLAFDGNGLLIPFEALTMNSSNASALHVVSGSNTWESAITLSRDTSINVSPSIPFGNLNAFSSTISGPGGLTKRGPGALLFAGCCGNSYTGLTTVAEGLLSAERTSGGSLRDVLVASNAQLVTFGSLAQIFSLSRVTVQSGGVWSMNSTNETIRGLFGGGNVNIPTMNGGTLNINNDVNCEFSGSLSGGGHLTKNSGGTFRLSGNSSGFNGDTLIMFGDCKVDGNMVNSPFSIQGGGHLVGDGIVGNLASSNNGALLRPDSKFADHQGADIEVGNLNLPTQFGGAGCTVQLEFFGPSDSVGNDMIVARGSVTLGGAVLAPFFRYAPHEGDTITLIDKRSSGAITGTFFGIPQNSLIDVNGIDCRFSYTGGDGNDATLTVTNLPLSSAGVVVFSGNGNDSVENDECVLLNVSLRNRRPVALTPTNVQLRVLSQDVMVTVAEAIYPPVPPGGVMSNSTPFQIRTSSQFNCGKKVSMELQVTVPGEGTFAIPFATPNSPNCGTPGGGTCESCTIVSGVFDTNTTTMASRPYFVGDVSGCFPTKACPGADPDTNLPPARFITHSFTNTTTHELCVTAQIRHDCPTIQPPNALGVSAYLGSFNPALLCTGYLGDGGTGGPTYAPFSFVVPAGTNFVLVVTARTNLDCGNYILELFGLPCPPPTLQIASDTTNPLVVSWSSAYPDFTLQQAPEVIGTFSDSLQTPVVVNSRYAVTNIPATSNQFFRLKK